MITSLMAKLEPPNFDQCHNHNYGTIVVITTAQIHSTKPELRFCTGSKSACGVPEIRDMVSAGNKAKRLSSVNHTTKTINHHHHHHHHFKIPLF